jgi:hypothetical protein
MRHNIGHPNASVLRIYASRVEGFQPKSWIII